MVARIQAVAALVAVHAQAEARSLVVATLAEAISVVADISDAVKDWPYSKMRNSLK